MQKITCLIVQKNLGAIDLGPIDFRKPLGWEQILDQIKSI
jgi:hypothetical protein